MKYIKNFESIKDNPEVGDYILAKYNSKNDFNTSINNLKNFINNTIGIVHSLDHIRNSCYFNIKYENIPKNIINFFDDDIKRFNIESIVEFDKDLEHLKFKIEAKKFNI